MTTPRRVLPGQTYFVTRRCSERRFFLVPSSVVNQVFLYCLAVAARLTSMELHAVCVMSNHIHVVLTDTKGVIPTFMAWLNRHAALCLKVLRNRTGPIWDASEKYSAVALTTPLAVYRKIVYTLTNPVNAGLVRSHKEWPGLCLGPANWLGAPIETCRPPVFFRGEDQSPPTLRLTVPPALAHWNPQRLVESLTESVVRREHSIAREMSRRSRHFQGRAAVCRETPDRRPKTDEPARTRNPAFAAGSRAASLQVIREFRRFRAAYRSAVERFRTGDTSVIFPPGTWWMVQYAGARCADTHPP